MYTKEEAEKLKAYYINEAIGRTLAFNKEPISHITIKKETVGYSLWADSLFDPKVPGGFHSQDISTAAKELGLKGPSEVL